MSFGSGLQTPEMHKNVARPTESSQRVLDNACQEGPGPASLTFTLENTETATLLLLTQLITSPKTIE